MLLDTQVLLWISDENPRLGVHAGRRIRASNAIFFSSLSLVEIAIKQMNGKLDAPVDLGDRLSQLGLTALAFQARHAVAIDSFPELSHHDPFDRMLVAQAASERMAFLTADRRLLGLELDWIIDARE